MCKIKRTVGRKRHVLKSIFDKMQAYLMTHVRRLKFNISKRNNRMPDSSIVQVVGKNKGDTLLCAVFLNRFGSL